MNWETLFTTDVLERLGVLVGWISGVSALTWNIWAHFAAMRRKNELRITASYTSSGAKQIVTVTFQGLEPHASYAVIVKSPSPKNITLAEFDQHQHWAYRAAGNQIVLPAELPMTTIQAGDIAQASFIVNGMDPEKLLRLTFMVKHRLLPKILARRRLPLHLT